MVAPCHRYRTIEAMEHMAAIGFHKIHYFHLILFLHHEILTQREMNSSENFILYMYIDKSSMKGVFKKTVAKTNLR